MGRRGPLPLPTAVKAERGTLRPSRLVANEFAPPLAVPEPPSSLSTEARFEWSAVVPHLTGVLTLLDATVLEAFCENVALAKRFQAAAAKDPVTKDFGRLIVNPASAAAIRHWQLARQLGQEIGWSPAARSRVFVPADSKG